MPNRASDQGNTPGPLVATLALLARDDTSVVSILVPRYRALVTDLERIGMEHINWFITHHKMYGFFYARQDWLLHRLTALLGEEEDDDDDTIDLVALSSLSDLGYIEEQLLLRLIACGFLVRIERGELPDHLQALVTEKDGQILNFFRPGFDYRTVKLFRAEDPSQVEACLSCPLPSLPGFDPTERTLHRECGRTSTAATAPSPVAKRTQPAKSFLSVALAFGERPPKELRPYVQAFKRCHLEMQKLEIDLDEVRTDLKSLGDEHDITCRRRIELDTERNEKQGIRRHRFRCEELVHELSALEKTLRQQRHDLQKLRKKRLSLKDRLGRRKTAATQALKTLESACLEYVARSRATLERNIERSVHTTVAHHKRRQLELGLPRELVKQITDE